MHLLACRDRADERRRGITVEESAPSYLTAEETRYLGGSVERTHLVRGLDRLLLNQVRDKAAGSAERDHDVPKAESDGNEALAVPTTFQTALGRAVGTYLLNPPSSNISELFQPKRMAFVYFADAKGSDDEADEEEDDGEEGEVYTFCTDSKCLMLTYHQSSYEPHVAVEWHSRQCITYPSRDVEWQHQFVAPRSVLRVKIGP
jgi:hypothetical protein